MVRAPYVPGQRSISFFEGSRNFRNNFQTFQDSVEETISSNDDFDLEQFQFILDTSGPLAGGGEKRKRVYFNYPKSFYNKKNEIQIPTHLRHSNGINFVPPDVDGYCGWACLVLHMVHLHGLSESLTEYGLPGSFWNGIVDPDILRQNDCLQPSFGNRMVSWFQRNSTQLSKSAKALAIRCGNTEGMFTVPNDCERLCNTFPFLRVIVVTQKCSLLYQHSGVDFVLDDEEDSPHNNCL